MPETKLIGPRYKYPVSDAELNRRLKAMQLAIKEKGLDCCVVQTQNIIFDSVIRYFVDTVLNAYSTTLIIPADGGIVMLDHGLDMDDAAIPPTHRNVEKLIRKPYCQPFGCTDGLAGAAVSRELNSRNMKRIGFAMKQLMSADLLDSIRENVTGCELVDLTTEFSYIKAVKSPEEWTLIDKCLRVNERIMDAMPALIRPGRLEYEILADMDHLAKYAGADLVGSIGVGSAPNGSGVMFAKHYNGNRRLEAGDGVTILVELSGSGGIYGEVARTFCLGEPNPALLELFEISKGAQWVVADAAKPGVTGRDLNRIFNDYVAKHGVERNLRFVGHSQGYDMMESPAICETEEMELREDMFLAIHPELYLNGQFINCCDNFRIGKSCSTRLTRTEQKVFILD